MRRFLFFQTKSHLMHILIMKAFLKGGYIMRPGPRAPYHGMNMMMGPGPSRFGSGPYGGSFRGPMGPPSGMNPMVGMRQPAKQGGILARLLGKGRQGAAGGAVRGFGGGALQGGSRTAGGGLLNAISNPGNINSFLNNTQQVLKTAQQVGPMIQQYGPIVKNLPAMWKLYRGFKDLPDEPEQKEQAKETKETKNTSKTTRRTTTTRREQTSQELNEKPKRSLNTEKQRESTPKLFY